MTETETSAAADPLASQDSEQSQGFLGDAEGDAEGPAGGPSPTLRRWFYLALAPLLVGLGAVHALFVGPYFVDDAYITIHNAEVLLTGYDLSYPGSSALTGATCAPHVVLIALLLPFVGGAWSAWVVSFAGAVLFAYAIARLGFRLGLSLLTCAALTLGALTLANTPYQLLNGLETSLAMAGLSWSLVFALTPGELNRRLTAVMCGLLPFLRPELVAFVGLLAAACAFERFRETRAWRLAFRSLAELVPYALVAALPWLLMYGVLTGSLVPSTVGAKAAYFAEGCWSAQRKLQALSNHFARLAGDCGPWLVGFLWLAKRRIGQASLAFVLVFCIAYYVQFPGALGHYVQRYLYLFMPLMVLGVGFSLTGSRHRLKLLGNVLLWIGLAYNLYRIPQSLRTIEQVARMTRVELVHVAKAANHRLPPDAVVLIHDAGFFGYATDFQLVDLVGLKTPQSSEFHRVLTLPSCGRRRWQAVHEVAIRSEASHMVVLRGWDRIYGLTQALIAHGWKLDPVDLREHGYDIYKITPPR